MNASTFIKTIPYKPQELELGLKNISTFISSSISVTLNTITSESIFHIGAFTYTDGKWDNTNQSGYNIKSGTLDKTRYPLVKKLLEWIYIKDKVGTSHLTITTKLNYLKGFINWADINKCSQFHQSLELTRKALRAYCRHIEEQIRINAITVNTGAALIKEMDDILAFVWDVSCQELRTGIRMPRYSATLKNTTTPPATNDLKKVLTLYKELFLELSDFLIQNQKYPHKVKILNEELYIFPSTRMTVSSKLKEKRYKRFDYQSGKLIVDSSRVGYTQKKMERANDDIRHSKRLVLANTACECFYMLFIANTGMNPYTAANLKWDNEYEIDSPIQKFRAIKYRAGNKPVRFDVTIGFMPLFKKFLLLRNYITNNREFNNLFVRFVFNKDELISFDPKSYENLHKKITTMLDPEFPAISPRELRAHKAVTLINSTDIATTAMILQNTEATVAKAYVNGRPEDAVKEMSSFYDEVSKVIINKNTKTQPIPAGQCAQINIPAKASETDPIAGDCSNSFSCLFCDKYGIHADENDLRKILSIRYIAKESRILAHSDEHYEKVFGALIKKINAIIYQLESTQNITKNIIQKVMNDVDKNENLTSFWQNKLNTLAKLGII